MGANRSFGGADSRPLLEELESRLLLAVVTIADVPSYIWYNGCGPTAEGMIIGYWDAHGYGNLIPGSNDWSTNQQAIKDMIASPGHVRDYAPTPDRVATIADPYHANDSVADFSWTSRDWPGHTTAFGWSSFGMQPQGLSGYAAFKGYTDFNSWTATYYDDSFWTAYVDEINAGRPVELTVDSNADGLVDHFMTGIGFDNSTSVLKYAAYNTWDQSIHWYDVGFVSQSKAYGVYGGTFLIPGSPDSGNQAPTDISLSASIVAENQPAATTVGTFSTTDPDSGDTFTGTLVSGTGSADNGLFTISANQLKTAGSFDYEVRSSYSIRVRSTDAGGLWTEKVFVVSVADVNESPTDLSLLPASLAENQPAATTVGTFATTDPDTGNTFTYSLVSGTGSADNASFAISGSTLQTAAMFDYEAKSSYSVRIRTTDQGGLWYEEAFTVTVTNVNETPTDLGLSVASVTENQLAGTTVGSFTTTDPDTGNTFTYGLVSGTGSADNASFTISETSLRAAGTFDYEARSTYSIRVRSTDAGGLSTEKQLTITVSDVNEPPTDVSLSTSTLAENQLSGTVVGVLSGTDPDAGQSATLTFSLVSGYGDNGLFQIVGSQLKANTVFDYEARNAYTIKVRAADAGGPALTCDKVFTINVIDVNEPPRADDLALEVSEGAPNGTSLGTVVAADVDAGDVLAYSIIAGNTADAFAIESASGAIRVNNSAALDHETAASWTLTVQVQDTGGLSDTATVSITIDPVNNAPVLDNSGTMSLPAIKAGTADNAGTSVPALIAGAGGDRITDADAGALEGIAVIAVDNANGTWQYSTDAGTNWLVFGTPSNAFARLLTSDAATRIRFVPNEGFRGKLSSGMTFRAWDRTRGANGGTADASGNGGSAAFSTATETAAVAVLGSNSRKSNNASWSAAPVTLDADGQASLTELTAFDSGDVDWYRFTVPYGATGAVQVSLANVVGGLKAQVALYDSVVGSLADQYGGIYTTLFGPKQSADATTADQDVVLTRSGLLAGTTYYLKVGGLNGTMGIYDLSIAAAMLPADANEPNNTSGAATDITAALVSGQAVWGQDNLSIHRSSDEDWFRVDAPANTDGDLVATVGDLTGGLAGLVWIYRQLTPTYLLPMGIGVFANWMPGGRGSARVYNAQPNTTYWIRVDNFWNETGGYVLDVQLDLAQQARDVYETGTGNNVSWSAAPIALAGGQAALSSLTIHRSSDVDWFSFTASANGNAAISLGNVGGGLIGRFGLYESVVGSLSDMYPYPPYTTLYGPKQQADAAGANQNLTMNVAGLVAGRTYYVKVSGKSSTTGVYTLGIQMPFSGLLASAE